MKLIDKRFQKKVGKSQYVFSALWAGFNWEWHHIMKCSVYMKTFRTCNGTACRGGPRLPYLKRGMLKKKQVTYDKNLQQDNKTSKAK